jgi:hypothetical protein
MSAKLRLGPLPKTESVKLTIVLSARLKEDLDRYSQLHTKTWGAPTDAAALIPHMLESFIVRDRAFRGAAKAGKAEETIPSV